MSYQLSNCVSLGVENVHQAIEFYVGVMDMKVKDVQPDWVELDSGPLRLFVSKDNVKGPVLEFNVEDVMLARAELERGGCIVVKWHGASGSYYMRDPNGLIFNLYQESGS